MVCLDLLLISSPPKCSPSDFQSHKQLGSSSSFQIKLLNVPASSRRSNQRKLLLGSQCSWSNWGILVKLVICVVPGHWKIKILNLKKRNKFFCFFMFLYPIQGGKNIGSPYLTNKSWFFGKSDVPGQQNKSYIGVMASKNLIFLMFWLSFVYL